MRAFECLKHAFSEESPNQDSWCMLKTEDFSIYGVFDGHGQKGHDVSNFVKAPFVKPGRLSACWDCAESGGFVESGV